MHRSSFDFELHKIPERNKTKRNKTKHIPRDQWTSTFTKQARDWVRFTTTKALGMFEGAIVVLLAAQF